MSYDDATSLVVSGYGATIRVERGQLVISDGTAGDRTQRWIPRQPRTIRRLLITSPAGSLTYEAVGWLADAGIDWTMLTWDGATLATSGPRRAEARLLREQATAPATESGIKIVRDLLSAKIAGQAANVRDVLRVPGAAAMISEYGDEIARCDELDGLRGWEANAAAVYWQAWADRVSVPFRPSDARGVPAHWLRFTGRTSLVNNGYARNNRAADPVNALLNYAYRIAESEAVHACHALGLHPAVGVLHADKPGRDSMALDLVEAARPVTDALVLGLLDCGLGARNLDRRWFTETRDGQCRIGDYLRQLICSWAPSIRKILAVHATRAAQTLAGHAAGSVSLPWQPKLAAQAAVPPSSKRPARLRPGVTLADLLPDAVWESVRPLVPEPPKRRAGSKSGAPRTVTDRGVIAALAAHELLEVPWSAIPAGMSRTLARGRLLAWQWTGAWDQIAAQIQASGHLSALVAAEPRAASVAQ